ncbi:MAG TPA: tRNA lysidine(34) synthetase TilS, partial [Ilumatobacteraceae bacterium]|nr:tRNA lysidine(34) synthetase TilS [Ilumatobacteraceae bacterium]
MSIDQLIARCTFPAAGTDVTCAVSGGADSLALIVLAVRAGCRVTAIHVDHQLRAGSAAEADIVAVHAAALGARFERRVVDVGPGPNVEARARAARYAVLPFGVMTGHTADDQAETIILNLMRGSIGGLSGMRATTERGVQRPLLNLRRSDTVAVCAEMGIQPISDPSNADLSLRRNAVRHRILPLLSEIADRDIAPIL